MYFSLFVYTRFWTFAKRVVVQPVTHAVSIHVTDVFYVFVVGPIQRAQPPTSNFTAMTLVFRLRHSISEDRSACAADDIIWFICYMLSCLFSFSIICAALTSGNLLISISEFLSVKTSANEFIGGNRVSAVKSTIFRKSLNVLELLRVVWIILLSGTMLLPSR